MQAIILAAGMGKRLKELTQNTFPTHPTLARPRIIPNVW